MFLPEKWTARRGRAGVPATFLRRRWCRILRGFIFFVAMALLDGFAFLALDVFTEVTDTLALVRLRRIIGADIGGDLADQLPVDAFDFDLGVFRDSDLDALR